jgi:hypothetical protein
MNLENTELFKPWLFMSAKTAVIMVADELSCSASATV